MGIEYKEIAVTLRLKIRLRINGDGLVAEHVDVQSELGGTKAPTNARLKTIIDETAIEFDTTPDTIRRRDNAPAAVSVRRAFAQRAVAAGFSLSEIAREIGRHHTSILHLVSTVGVVKIKDGQRAELTILKNSPGDFSSNPQPQQQQVK